MIKRIWERLKYEFNIMFFPFDSNIKKPGVENNGSNT